VKANIRRAGLSEIADDAIDGLDHQMYVEWRFDSIPPQCIRHERTDRQVRDVMIIHDVEVNEISTGVENRTNFFAKTREIRRQNGWRNPTITHA
jgi:hypothetical protein